RGSDLCARCGAVSTGIHRIDLWNRIAIVVTLLQLLGVWFVLSRGGGLVALMVNTGVMLLLGVLVCVWNLRRLAPEIWQGTFTVDRHLVHRLTTYGVALQIINLGVLVQLQLEKVLFGRMLS